MRLTYILAAVAFACLSSGVVTGESLRPNAESLVAVSAPPAPHGENVGTILQVAWPSGEKCAAGVVNASQSRTGFGARKVQFFCSTPASAQPTIEALAPVPTEETRIQLINTKGDLVEMSSGLRLTTDKAWERLGNSFERNPSQRIWNIVPAMTGELALTGDGRAVFGDRTIAEFKLSYVSSLYYAGQVYFAGRDGNGSFRLGHCEWKSPDEDCGPIQYDNIPIMSDVYSMTGWNGSVYLAGDYSGIVRFDYEMEVISARAFGEFYGTVEIDDALYFGHFPSGYVFKLTKDGVLTDTQTPPTRANDWQGKYRFVVDRKLPTAKMQNYREAQTLYLFGGKMVVGMYPFGEVWTGLPGQSGDWGYQRMFKHPAEISGPFPYKDAVTAQMVKLEADLSKNGPRWLYPYVLGQRVHSMAPWGDSLALGAGNTNGSHFEKERDSFLTEEQKAEYKTVHLLSNEDTSQRPYPVDKPAVIELRTVGKRMQFAMNGVPASRIFDLPAGSADVSVGTGIFGRSEVDLHRR